MNAFCFTLRFATTLLLKRECSRLDEAFKYYLRLQSATKHHAVRVDDSTAVELCWIFFMSSQLQHVFSFLGALLALKMSSGSLAAQMHLISLYC